MAVLSCAGDAEGCTLSTLHKVDVLALDDHLERLTGFGRTAAVDAWDAWSGLITRLDLDALPAGEGLLGGSPRVFESLALEPIICRSRISAVILLDT